MLSIFVASYLILHRHNITNTFYILILISVVIFFLLFETSGVTYVRRRVVEAYDHKCVVPAVKFGGGSMSSVRSGMLSTCEGRMNSNKFISMLEEVDVLHWKKCVTSQIVLSFHRTTHHVILQDFQ